MTPRFSRGRLGVLVVALRCSVVARPSTPRTAQFQVDLPDSDALGIGNPASMTLAAVRSRVMSLRRQPPSGSHRPNMARYLSRRCRERLPVENKRPAVVYSERLRDSAALCAVTLNLSDLAPAVEWQAGGSLTQGAWNPMRHRKPLSDTAFPRS